MQLGDQTAPHPALPQSRDRGAGLFPRGARPVPMPPSFVALAQGEGASLTASFRLEVAPVILVGFFEFREILVAIELQRCRDVIGSDHGVHKFG